MILGDGKTCEVEGIGSIQLRMADGTLRQLDDVRYIPTMRRNLISLGTLVKKGYSVRMDGSGLRVLKG